MAASEEPFVMTQAEFARRRGVSKKSVTAWKGKGLLVMTANGKVEVEATEWNLDQRPETYRGGKAHRPIRSRPVPEVDPREQVERRRKPPNEPDPSRQAIPKRPGDPDDDDGYDPDAHDLSTPLAIRRKENFLGLFRRQEVLKNDKRLVDRAAAEALFFDKAKEFRDALTAWPARVAIELAEEIRVDPATGKIDYRSLTMVLGASVRQLLAEMGEPEIPDWNPKP